MHKTKAHCTLSSNMKQPSSIKEQNYWSFIFIHPLGTMNVCT